MKICIITGSFPARSETFVLQHVLGLARRGHEVTVLSFGSGGGISVSELKEVTAHGVKLLNVPTFEGSRYSKSLKLLSWLSARVSRVRYLFPRPPWTRGELYEADMKLKAIHQIVPDIIHVHYGVYAGPLLALGLSQTPLVTWHGVDANILPKFRGADMYASMFREAIVNTVGSSFMKQRLIDLHARPDSILTIPMGVDLSEFEFVERSSLAGEPVRIVSVGRLDEMKGHCYLIQAVSELIRSGADIVLRIVGEGPLRAELEKQILSCGCAERIELLGAKTPEEVKRELGEADIFSLTGVEATSGRVETQGVVLIEAQATGLPVVSSRVGGIPDSVVDGETAILCEPKNSAEIKKAIMFFTANPETRQKFGRAGRRFVETKFSIETMLDAFEAQYAARLVKQKQSSSIKVGANA